MSRSRFALGLAGVALVALGGGLVVALRQHHDKTSQAKKLISDADTPDARVSDQLAAAERALALDAHLEDAHAFRAYALARFGDLDEAARELELAGKGDRARRAHAWVLFRRGEVDAAFRALDWTTGWLRDHDELACACGRAPLANDATLSAEVEATRSRRIAPLWEGLLGPSLGTTRASLDALVNDGPRTIEGLTALRARARLEALAFDDVAATQDLDRAVNAPPREKALGEPDRAALKRIIEGARDLAPVPPLVGAGDPAKQGAWSAAADQVLAQAEIELERDELIDSDEDLDRAERRLIRLVSILPGEVRALVPLARALERRPDRNDLLLSKVEEMLAAQSFDKPEARASELLRKLELVRIELVRGHSDKAKAALDALSPQDRTDSLSLAERLRAIVERDGARAARTFGVDALEEPREGAVALHAALAFVLARPWDARADLEDLLAAHPGLDADADALARARARDDPTGAFLVLVRNKDHVSAPTREAVVRTAGLFLLSDVEALEDKLKSRGFTKDEITAAALLLRDRKR